MERKKSRRSRRKELERKLKKRAVELNDLQKKENRAAVAIGYDIENDAAPVILAVGRGPLAEEILRIAEENKIPLIFLGDIARMALGEIDPPV